MRHADAHIAGFHVRATVFDRSDNGRVRRSSTPRGRDRPERDRGQRSRSSEDLEKLVANRTDDLVKSNASSCRASPSANLQDQFGSAKMEAIGTLAEASPMTSTISSVSSSATRKSC